MGLILNIEIIPGTSFKHAVRQAQLFLYFNYYLDCITYNFNNYKVHVFSNSDPDKLYQDYLNHLTKNKKD